MNRFSKNYASLMILLALAAALVASSCYTILRHPRIPEADYERPSDVRCVTCHTEEEIWHYHHPSTRFIYFENYHPGWEHYYDTPWWYDQYWYYPDPDSPETSPLYRRSLRSTRDKGVDTEIRSGTIRGTSEKLKTESTENVKKKEKGSESKDESSKSKKRSVRPKKKKKDEDG